MAKMALAIGVSEYAPGLCPLPAAIKDAEAMRRVLQHPEIGGFNDVKMLLNPEPQDMREAIETLFADRMKEDVVLLFFSGHAVQDDNGKLHLATRRIRKNQRGELVQATAVPASFVQEMMSNSRSKYQVVILDCCHSGAFAEGLLAKDDSSVDVKNQLGGEGRAILTSSTSAQYSFAHEGSDLSTYTRYLVEGIETGAADLDNDGVVSIDELHEYTRKKVHDAAPAMKPELYPVKEGYKIHLSHAPNQDPKLRYRKQVDSLANCGVISDVGRNALDALRAQLRLLPEDAATIEEQVLQPYQEYQKKLQQYEQTLVQEIQREPALSSKTRNELQALQRILGLRDEDITQVEAQISSQKKAIQPSGEPAEVMQSFTRADVATVKLRNEVLATNQSETPTPLSIELPREPDTSTRVLKNPKLPIGTGIVTAQRLDLERSVVFLCGTSHHDDPELIGYEEVEHSLTKLQTLFADDNIVGIQQVTLSHDASRKQLLTDLARECAKAADTFIFYYIGHGLIGQDGKLYLVGSDTEMQSSDDTGVEFDKIKQRISGSPARRKIVILDSCYSGRMEGQLGDTTSYIRATLDDVEGTYFIASAPSNEQALASDGHGYTAFSGQVIKLLEEGIPDGNEHITVDQLYESVRRELLLKSKPEPQRRGSQNIGKLIIARNKGIDKDTVPCTIVSPAPDPSETRATIKEWEQLIIAACQQQHFTPGPILRTNRIDSRSLAVLDSAPFVAFYLRERKPDDNFFFMMGYRYRTGLPTLCFAHDNGAMARDFPEQAVALERLPSIDEIPRLLHDDAEKEELLHRLSEVIKQAVEENKGSQWQSVLAMATLRMDQSPTFVESTPNAARLFHLDEKHMSTATLDDLMKRLCKFMRKTQWPEFRKEQEQLIGALQTSKRHVFATKPIYFKAHDELDPDMQRIANPEVIGRAFLPIIVRYSYRDNALMLLIIYIDVTEHITTDKDGVASCDLFAMYERVGTAA